MNEYYNTGALSVRGLKDGGVGGPSATFAVGDCGIVANSDSLKSTPFVPAEGLANVSNVSELPEEDKTKDFADDKGLNCFVGEVTAIADGLGNAATLPGVPIGTRNYFGVDKGSPVVTDVEPAANVTILKNGARLGFKAEDPDLATGEDGSGIWGVNWTVGTRTVATKIDPASGLRVTSGAFPKDGAYRVTADIYDNASPGNGSRVPWSFTRDTEAPTFTVSKSQSSIGNTQATTVIVSVGGTISDANGIEKAELSVRPQVAGACPTKNDDDLNLPARRVTGNKRDLSDDGSKAVTFDETFTVKSPSAGDISGTTDYVQENLCFYLSVEDVATDEEGDGPGNIAPYDVGSFSVNWRNPGSVHRLGAANWDATAQPAAAGAAITDDAPLMVAEGATAQYVVTLTSAPRRDVVVRLSAPATVTVDPASVTIARGAMVSPPITVTAGHDRNVISEEAVITATAASVEPRYNGATGSVAVTSADDDYKMSVFIKDRSGANRFDGVTEQTPFNDGVAVARWVTIRITAPEGGEANLDAIMLGSGGDDYTFRRPSFELYDNSPDPYLGTEQTVTSRAPIAYSFLPAGASETDVWLVANDDLEDEEVEFIQIGADPDDEAGRIEPVMIRIDDADPDVTLSIGDVSEGADGTTMTITATAAGPDARNLRDIGGPLGRGRRRGSARGLCIDGIWTVDHRPQPGEGDGDRIGDRARGRGQGRREVQDRPHDESDRGADRRRPRCQRHRRPARGHGYGQRQGRRERERERRRLMIGRP